MSTEKSLRQAWSLSLNVRTKKPSLDKNERSDAIMTSKSTYQIIVAVIESAHSQVAKEAVPHLYKQERKCPTPVRRRLSRTQAFLGRVIPGGWVPVADACGIVRPLRIPLVIRPVRRTYVVVRWTNEMVCGGYKRVSRFEVPCICTRWMGEHWVEQMSRLHGTSCWRQCGSTVTKASRLDACEDWKVIRWCRTQTSSHNRKAALMAGSMRQVWPLRHQTGEQYSAVECTRDRVAIRRVVAPAPQPEPASRLRNTTRDVSLLQSDSMCRRYVRDLSNVTTPKYLSSEQTDRILLLYFTL